MSKCKRCPQKATFRASVENKTNPLENHFEQLCGNCLREAGKNEEVLDYWPKSEQDNGEESKNINPV